ncbi:MAG TPA: hypothetical protein VGD81_06900 [Opitutaceae bacterium]
MQTTPIPSSLLAPLVPSVHQAPGIRHFLALTTLGLVLASGGNAARADETTNASDDPPVQTVPRDGRMGSDRFVRGESTRLKGGHAVAWAILSRSGKIEEVGVTISLGVFRTEHEPGDGPLDAIASLEFPRVVREATYFNHCQVHWNPHGHASPPSQPERYAVPHFDVHFYSVPEAVVWAIPALPPPLPDVPADLLPAGWQQAGPSEPEMGRHSSPDSIADGPFAADMIAGFLPSGRTMHFIEPMFTPEFLARAEDFTMPVPRPQRFGRTMLYPETFSAEYDSKLNAYHFVFRQFGIVE